MPKGRRNALDTAYLNTRLPKEVLDDEILTIEKMGVEIVTDTKIGEDIPFETVRADFDAVLLGIGAWISTGLTGCKARMPTAL